jgi:hypothetical protein
MRKLAGLVQVLGLLIAPSGLMIGLATGDTALELSLLAAGGTIFCFGKYVLEPRSK